MKLVIVYSPVYEYAMGNPKRIGGAERQQWLLARALARAGWVVTVGVREGLKFQERVVIDGVNFVGIGQGQYLLSFYHFLVSEQPDWCYWRAAEHWLGLVVQVAKFVGVRTIFAAAFDTDVEPRHALTHHPQLWPLFAWGLAQTDRIYVQHGGQFERLAKRWQTKAYIVPSLAGELAVGPPHAKRKGYVAWLGTLRRPKRADLLIEIAQRLPDVEFVVCGGTTSWRSTKDYGRQTAQSLQELSNVNYMGQVDPQIAKKIIADASLLLSTSDGEGFPNSFLEAWSCGTPVVSVSIDPDKVIQRKGLGAVTGNLDGAVVAIKDFMASPRHRDEMAIRAREHVHASHGEGTVMKIFESAIRGER